MPQPRAFKLEQGEGERLCFSDAVFFVRASAEMTAGAFSIIEEVAPLDTPMHVHAREDELFYVLRGSTRSSSETTSSASARAPWCSRRAASRTRIAAPWRDLGGF